MNVVCVDFPLKANGHDKPLKKAIKQDFMQIENVRLATLDALIENVVPLFISPIPSRDTLRDWFDAANIPRFKANPTAKRGGGTVFYSVPAVEKFFRSRTTGAYRFR